MTNDPVNLLQQLIRCPSVTPHEGGALDLIEKILAAHGFICHRLTFSEQGTPDVQNLYARKGTDAPHICFAGHTDVVPVGDLSAWSVDPFAAVIKPDGFIYGRGAADMKGSIAAFIAATLQFLEKKPLNGSISFLLTGDEEGPAINGTKKVLEWLEKRGEKIDFCLVGEPTSRETLGDMIKIGRRGSMTGYLTVHGKQGHAAYPHLADNPLPKLVTLLKVMDDLELDQGSVHFQPSNLEIVTIDVGNKADNVIPAQGRATFNIRFNDTYTSETLKKKISAALDSQKIPYEIDFRVSGESFYTPPGKYSDLLQQAIQQVAGKTAGLSTTGGTSDARFIKKYCPVAEFGIVGATSHQTDERVKVADVISLTAIYHHVLSTFFS